MKLELRKFDMSRLRANTVSIMLGKRNTGKSFLCKDLLYFHTDLPTGVVISATECVNKFYGDIFPPVFIYDEFKPEILEKVIRRQRKVTKYVKDMERRGQKPDVDPRCILILDDCLYDSKSWVNDSNIRQIFMNGRHLNIMFLLTSQYALGIPPQLRGQVDYVFILRDNIVQNRKRLYENYCGMLPTFDVFCAVMDQCTSNHECLVVDNTTSSNKIEDIIFWYKAEHRPPFQIGSRVFWEANNANLAEDDSDDGEESFDPGSVVKKKGPKINVIKK